MAGKSEDELIGALVKLRKQESEISSKIDKLENTYEGPFHDALEKKYAHDTNGPDPTFKARMSINPDRIVALATELKGLQKEYEEAHNATRKFETTYPQIAKILDTRYY